MCIRDSVNGLLGGAAYDETGSPFPDETIRIAKECDSILLGAVGFPGVPDHVSLWGLLIR